MSKLSYNIKAVSITNNFLMPIKALNITNTFLMPTVMTKTHRRSEVRVKENISIVCNGKCIAMDTQLQYIKYSIGYHDGSSNNNSLNSVMKNHEFDSQTAVLFFIYTLMSIEEILQ